MQTNQTQTCSWGFFQNEDWASVDSYMYNQIILYSNLQYDKGTKPYVVGNQSRLGAAELL